MADGQRSAALPSRRPCLAKRPAGPLACLAQAARRAAIEAARGGRSWGLVLGTLGRQGNPAIMDRLKRLLERQGRSFVTVLLSGARLRRSSPSVIVLFAACAGCCCWAQLRDGAAAG